MFSSYYDFQLGNKKLSDFGGVLYNENGDGAKKVLLPQMNNQTEQLPLVDGSILYGSSYQPRTIEVNIVIDNKSFDEAAFINWIKSKEIQWFNYVGDNKKIQVVYEDEISMTMYNTSQALITIKFIAYNPYWYLIDDVVVELENPVVNKSYSFVNKGNDISFPLIKLSYNGQYGDVTFQLNGKQYKILKPTSDIYIDFYTETVYSLVTDIKINKLTSFKCLNGKYKYEFGNLKMGNNTIKVISGTLSSIIINCKSRFI